MMSLKRIFDLAAATTVLIILFPVFLFLSLAIKLDSPGPIFYKARRIGRGGLLFYMYKFRTMVAQADLSGPALTYKADPRITRVGRWLRKVRLDELPQLINVLKGEMSMVGPRPEAPEFVRAEQPLWPQVLSVAPGMCGLAQLAFAMDEHEVLNNVSTLDHDYLTQILPVKLQLDVRYVHTQSLLLDITLLVKTFWLVVRPNRAATVRV